MTTISATALYRYPVKGMTPERCERIEVLPSGAILGDRTLAFAFANAAARPDGRWNPRDFVILKHTPVLTLLRLELDLDAGELSLKTPGGELTTASLDATGRTELSGALEAYLLEHAGEIFDDHPDRLPLRLLGDPPQPTFQDRGPQHVSIIGRASLEHLAEHMGSEIDERRFRANVIVDGTEPWEELSWPGRTFRAGAATLRVEQPIVRCVATHAHPDRGEWDLDVLGALTVAAAQEQPVMGVIASVIDPGEIATGDSVLVEPEAG